MKTISEYTDLAMPDYALSYLINGDDSGIDAADKENADSYMQQFHEEAKAAGGFVEIVMHEEEASFSRNPEFGLACNCMNCTILILA
jgi:hypothetical protein